MTSCKGLMKCAWNESFTEAVDCIRTDLVARCDNGFITRAGHISLMPLYVIASAIDAILGVGAAFLSIVTLGTKTNLNEFAVKKLRGFDHLTSNLYFCLLSILNPNLNKNTRAVPLSERAFFTNNCKKNPLGSRLIWLINIPICGITKIIDIAIAIVQSPAAILLAFSQKNEYNCPSPTGGNCPVNTIIATSTQNLSLPIAALYARLLRVINPGARFFPPQVLKLEETEN